MSNPFRTLMMTSDGWLTENFAQIASELGIEALPSENSRGIPEELNGAKYEGVLLDFDVVPEAMAVLRAVRRSRSNDRAVVFAVVTGASEGQQILKNGANLLLERPLNPQQIRRALYAAYDLMVRERRRYFRCTVEAPVLVLRSSLGADVRCTSINLSSKGIAFKAPIPFALGEELQIIVCLSEGELAIRATGTVVWDDGHGKTGVSFSRISRQHQNDLDGWLDSRLLILHTSMLPRKGTSN